jgi:hypothetical protein
MARASLSVVSASSTWPNQTTLSKRMSPFGRDAHGA